MSPSLEIISQSRDLEVDQNVLKIVILGFFGVALSILSIYYFNYFLITASLQFAVFGAFFASIFFAVNILSIILIKNMARLGFIIFLEAIAPLALFYNHLYPEINLPLIAGAMAFFILAASAAHRGAKILGNSLKIDFWRVAANILPKVVTGFFAFLAVILYMNYFMWGKFTESMGRSFFSDLIDSGQSVSRFWLPDYNFKGTVNDFVRNLVLGELQKTSRGLIDLTTDDFGGDFTRLPPSLQEKVLSQVTEQAMGQLAARIGPFNPNDSVKNVMYKVVREYFDKFSAAAKSGVGIIIAISAFFTFKGFAVIFYWLVYFLAFLLYKLSLVSGFAYVSLENRRREFVIMR